MTRRSALSISLLCFSFTVAVSQAVPHYKVDPSWPQELPNNWTLGQIRGVAVDSTNHVWVLNEGGADDDEGAAKTPPLAECCIPAPAVVEFSGDGKVLAAWGGQGYVPSWPESPHGIYVDKKGNVWIGGVGSPWNSDVGTPKPIDGQPWDRQVLKFSAEGKLLLQIGKPSNAPVNNEDPALLGAPSAIKVDDAANEVYIADGFFNKRVVVYDANTGAFKRGWGAYGIPLSKVDNSTPAVFPAGRPDLSAPPSKQFGSLTDIAIAADGLIYVADQINDRIQAFTKAGKFVKEFSVAPQEIGYESAWALAISPDAKQRYLFVTDGASGLIRVFDRRGGTELNKFGHKGRDTGEFTNLGWAAFDSQADLYTGEVHFTRSFDAVQSALSGKSYTPGGRVQKFVRAE